jgi:hypothetical protein
MPAVLVFNVKSDMPSLDEARRRVIAEIRRARQGGVRVLKIIHGYGSSGVGGTLNIGLRKSFTLRKKEGVIRDFVPGEEFNIFNPTVLAMLDEVPELKGDAELSMANEGMTVVWIK